MTVAALMRREVSWSPLLENQMMSIGKPISVMICSFAVVTFATPAGKAQQRDDNFKKWDRNKDGKLARDEVPQRGRAQFDKMDTNRDGFVTWQEVQTFRQRMRGKPGDPNAGITGDGAGQKITAKPVSVSTELAPVQKLTAATQDNRAIRAFYRKPLGDGPFPTVVFIHGGATQFGDRILRDTLVTGPTPTRFLAAGYVAVAAEFRTYAQDMQSRGPIYDCLAIVEHAKELPFVDADSVVCFGGSGGGSITLELAGLTPLAAAVCGEPATIIFTGMLRDYEKRMEVMAAPKRYYTEQCRKLTQKKVKRIRCPIMIVQSDEHPLNRLNNEIFIPELKAAGVKTEVKAYPGHPHGFYWGHRTDTATVEQMVADVLAFLKPRLKTQPKRIARVEPQRSSGKPTGPNIPVAISDDQFH